MSNSYSIQKITNWPIQGFSELKLESQAEGFRFLSRLEEEWENGQNQFSQSGEGLYSIISNGELIAIGGINIDPYSPDSHTGRLRRFYVKKAFRKQGIGRQLVNHIIHQHQSFFEKITLFTDNTNAARFYESCGFGVVLGKEKISHVFRY